MTTNAEQGNHDHTSERNSENARFGDSQIDDPGTYFAGEPGEGTACESIGGNEGESVDVMTVFETLESAFWWVAAGPLPLTVHPHHFSDLPDRALSLHQLRVRLASPTVSHASRAAIWSYLVRHARTAGVQQPDWTIAAAGVALPDLMRIVAALTRTQRGKPGRVCDVADLEAAALGGFYAELRRTDLDDTSDHRIRWRLLMAAYRAARTLRDTTEHTAPDHDSEQQQSGQTGRAYPRSSARAVQRARRNARHARQACQRAGRTRGGQVRP